MKDDLIQKIFRAQNQDSFMICNCEKHFQKHCEKPKRLSTKMPFIDHRCHAYNSFHIFNSIVPYQFFYFTEPILHSNKDKNQLSLLVNRESFLRGNYRRVLFRPFFSQSFSFFWYFNNQMSSFRYTSMISRCLHKSQKCKILGCIPQKFVLFLWFSSLPYTFNFILATFWL